MILIVAMGSGAGMRAQTEMRTLNPRDYASIDTMWYLPDSVQPSAQMDAGTMAYRFLTIENRDSSLSIYDTHRHWMSPKMWGVDLDNYNLFHITDNVTTSIFYIYDAQPGWNWIVTMSGDRVMFPSTFTLDTIPGGMLSLEYGADRYTADPNAYASLRAKAKSLVDRCSAMQPWRDVRTITVLSPADSTAAADSTATPYPADSLRQVEVATSYAIEYPQGDQPVDAAVRQWISTQLAQNIACYSDSALAVLDASAVLDTALVYRYYASTFARMAAQSHEECINNATIIKRVQLDAVVTYLADCNSYAGGAAGKESFGYASFDLATGQLLTSSDIINANSRAAVNQLIASDLNRQMRASATSAAITASHCYNPGGDEGVQRQLCAAPCAFLPSGVVFTYEPYELGQDDDSIYFVVIPYSRIQPYLKMMPGKIS